MYTDLFKELADILQKRAEFLTRIPDEYVELRQRLEALPPLAHIGLWHDQMKHSDAAHPLPTPAAFIGFNTLQVNDAGQLMQTTTLQVDVYLLYHTAAGTAPGVVVEDEALTYLDLLLLVGLMLHGRSGTHFHQMRRAATAREECDGGRHLYRISFETNITEFSGLNLWSTKEMADREIAVTPGIAARPGWETDNELYRL